MGHDPVTKLMAVCLEQAPSVARSDRATADLEVNGLQCREIGGGSLMTVSRGTHDENKRKDVKKLGESRAGSASEDPVN